MKIVTWNLERPKINSGKLVEITRYLQQLNADIYVLTETNDCVNLGSSYHYYHSEKLPTPYYKNGERRITMISKFQAQKILPVYNSLTSLAIEFETPIGSLIAYGTITGIFGNRRADFLPELDLQVQDWRNLNNGNFLIAGDLNMSFSDNYYFTRVGRQKFVDAFRELDLVNLTENVHQNIDHVIISREKLKSNNITVQTWNLDKKLSDHIGLCVEIADSPSQ
ncbi:MAG: endonuclease/exonuclease/phosphatase family protein [Flavobacterium sp.]|nr:MAG: endonuclease/exonuclease/phosphatase family protein [Flavobacterium sp.]